MRRDISKWLAYKLLVVIILVGCNNAPLKESSLKARSIIQEATNRLAVSRIDEIESQGKRESTIVGHESAKASEYLRTKERELRSHYEIIKGHLKPNSEEYDDALYVAAFINEMLYFLSGPTMDDRCVYIRTIKDRKEAQLSNWVLNEFFAPLKGVRDYHDSWLKTSETHKLETIYNIVMSSSEECLRRKE
jgi:hypothetical protein